MRLRDRDKDLRTGGVPAFLLRSTAGFTLIELLVVISIIGVLASLIVGIAGGASSAKKLSAAKGKLKELELVIENYKASVGGYPPDSKFASGQINSVTNQLFYELTGTLYKDGRFNSNQGGQGLNRQVCRRFFGVDGIQNTATVAEKTKSFIELGSNDFAALTGGDFVAPNILLAPGPWPQRTFTKENSDGQTMEIYRPIKSTNPSLRTLNPFQYRSSGRDRHNLASYDLWVDIPIKDVVYRVSNWRTEPRIIFQADK